MKELQGGTSARLSAASTSECTGGQGSVTVAWSTWFLLWVWDGRDKEASRPQRPEGLGGKGRQ